MIRVVTAIVPPDVSQILPGSGFVDAFEISIDQPCNASSVARHMMAVIPGWVDGLMRLRNTLVTPLGLKADVSTLPQEHEHLGMFPVIFETPDRVVMGFDDKHLDFRVILDCKSTPHGPAKVRLATAVRSHNLFGRLYLACVLPFHRIIVPAMLRRAATGHSLAG
jgi:Protein of unknown function (DUF2867)